MKSILILIKIAVFIIVANFSFATELPKKKISKKEQALLIEKWFANPYEYMFQGELYNYVGNNLDYLMTNKHQFYAGTKGFVMYGGIRTILQEFYNQSLNSYNFDEAVEALSGIKCYIKTQHYDNKKFNYINPEIIDWAYRQVPKPGLRVQNYRCDEIYESIFSRFFRLMTRAYIYANHENDINQLRHEYERVMYAETASIYDLEELYKSALPEFQLKHKFADIITPATAIGFWVRRNIDGSDQIIWEKLNSFMKLYDRKWHYLHKNI